MSLRVDRRLIVQHNSQPLGKQSDYTEDDFFNFRNRSFYTYPPWPVCLSAGRSVEKMVEVHRSNLPPTVSWISHQIFLQTTWTKVKQRQRGGDDRRTNCNLYPERTAHLFFHCSAATNLYNQLKLHINSYLQEYASDEPITIDLHTVLFHQTISGTHRGSIIHLLMVAKYTLYRSRFMTQNTPSTRFLILNMVLTLAKTLKLEQEQQMLHHIINRMKLQINLS